MLHISKIKTFKMRIVLPLTICYNFLNNTFMRYINLHIDLNFTLHKINIKDETLVERCFPVLNCYNFRTI